MENAKLGSFKIFNFKFLIFNSRKGFTLIEVLLSLAILSIILAALYGTFFLSHKAMEGIDDSLLKLQECRMAIDIMRRELDSISYSSGNKSSIFKVEDRDIYGKQASSFVFTTFSPLRPGLSKISYSVEERDGRLILFKTMGSAYGTDSGTKNVEMIEDIESFAVEIKNKNRWVKTWDSSVTKSIPEELRITLTTKLKNRTVSLFETVLPKVGKTI